MPHVVMRKLDTLVSGFPDTYKLAGQDEVSKTYSFPKSYISCRKRRVASTEQRERGNDFNGMVGALVVK